MSTERKLFEACAAPILGDKPNWRESGDCELMWFAWQAARTQPATPDLPGPSPRPLSDFPELQAEVAAKIASGELSVNAAPAQQGEPQVVPAGHALVPIEIPQEMFLRAEKAGISFATQQRVWPAMLAAAPQPEPLPGITGEQP